MKMIKKITAFILVAVLAVTCFAACGQQAPAPAPSQSGESVAAETAGAIGIHGSPDESYYMINFVSGVEYWFPVYAMFKQAGKQLGVQTYYTACPEYDAGRQVDVFEQTLAKNPTGIFLSPITAEAFKDPIDKAVASGVAVVTFASDSPDSARNAYITSDNVREGQFAARQMAADMGGTGIIMTLRNPGQSNHDIRVDTFRATIEAEFPGIQLVDDVPTNQDVEAAYTAVMTVSQKYPDLGGVFMPEASSGMGAARASKELGGNIRVLCVDVNETILDMIKAGDIWGAINPDQGMQGYWGMLLTFVAAHPELVDPMTHKKANGENPTFIPFMDNGLNIVTQDNADYYYVDKYAESLGYSSIDEMLSPHIP